MRVEALIAVAVILPTLAACASTEADTEPVFAGAPAAAPPAPVSSLSAIAGDYALVAYGASGLPFTTERDEVKNCVEEVTEGALHLGADGKWTYTYVERDTCDDRVTAETETVGGIYELKNNRLYFDEEFGEDGPEGEGAMEARNFDYGWFHGGMLLIEPEGIDGIFLAFQP